MDLKKLTIFGIFLLFAFIWCFKMAAAASNEKATKSDASNDGDGVAYAPDDWTMDGVYDHKRCGLPLKPLSPTSKMPTLEETPKIRAKRYKPHGGKPGNSSSKKIGRDEERKMMGGKAVQDGDFPWAVAIYAYGQYICSGTLISKRHVLTAAHCFQTRIDTGDGSCTIEGDLTERPIPIWPLELENVLKHYEVHLGSICLGDEEDFIRHEACKTTRGMQKFRLKSAIYQDWFRADCTGEDYALLELDLNDGQLPAEIANHICLIHLDKKVAGQHDWNYNTELDQKVTVFGWGTNPVVIENPDDPELPMYTLQRLEMPEIWSTKDCEKNLGKWFRGDIICTMEKRNEDVCKGDSGGGLISQFENESGEKRWYLLGAVSSGSDCIKLQKNTETPSAQYYTNVPMHNVSIDNFTGIGQQPEFKNINAVGRTEEKGDDAGDDLSDYDCDY